MYEMLTDRARKVMKLAEKDAICSNYEYVGTENILLGLIRERDGAAAMILRDLSVDLRMAQLEVDKLVQAGHGPEMTTSEKLPLSPQARKAIEFSIEESRNHKNNFVGTEHLLLGLIREDCLAMQVLTKLGIKIEDIRNKVLNVLD